VKTLIHSLALALSIATAISPGRATTAASADPAPSPPSPAEFRFGAGPRRAVPVVSSGLAMVARLARPAGRIAGLWRFAFARPALVHSADIARDSGRRVVYFPIGEPAGGLFVRVAGRVEFERAIVGFADGSTAAVDAFGLERRSGTYRLVQFDEDRPVDWVRLVLRARSRQAQVGILISRPAATPA
jgi:hypothetical protein